MNQTVLNIAHRGARSVAPENTLAAARKAFDLGAGWWELDVAMTADGALVVLHDDTLERTSNAPAVFPERGPWDVHDFTLAELRRLDFGGWFAEQDPFGTIAAGEVRAEELAAYAGEPIPTLREALELTRQAGKQVNVEIKDHSGYPGDANVVEAVVQLVNDLGMAEAVLISSFNHAYLLRSRAANPAIRTGALVETPTSDPLALLRATGADAYHPDLALVTDAQIAALRAAGFAVNVWTVNHPADMRRLVATGAGVITDFPQRLQAIFSE